ncbi:hypothetical protein CLU79DRAFT_750474 [Phycomyces nitens]|nr:hypothetical protein CLU79DRAFT_750474 [Phycomyces nitens]
MEKTISDYDESLKELDRQKETLERVMSTMGKEWEESGAGIGWIGTFFDETPEIEPLVGSTETIYPYSNLPLGLSTLHTDSEQLVYNNCTLEDLDSTNQNDCKSAVIHKGQ